MKVKLNNGSGPRKDRRADHTLQLGGMTPIQAQQLVRALDRAMRRAPKTGAVYAQLTRDPLRTWRYAVFAVDLAQSAPPVKVHEPQTPPARKKRWNGNMWVSS